MSTNAFAANRRRALTTSLPLLALASFAPLLASSSAHAQDVTFGGSAGDSTSTPPATPATAAATPAAMAPAPVDAPADGDQAASDAEWAQRDRQINEANTLTGSTGLLRTMHAESGAPGQFRLGFNTEYFSAGFLCSSAFPCPSTGGGPIKSDTMNHIGATLTLGITLAKVGSGFLEGYASTGAFANSDDANKPTLLQVLGDTNFGLKYGVALSKIFYVGGFAELWLINGTGSVGLDGGGTGAKFGPIATVDLRGNEAHTPLRFSFNAFYSLDNSGNVLTPTEDLRGQPVTRIERFGLGVNRVDNFTMRVGAEVFAAEERVRPFIEYGIALPNNRQNYACKSNNPSHDNCLLNDAIPQSTLTIGSRFYPWKRGFSLLAALDIGVTGTTDFIEEVAPTPPWTLFVGAGWAIDTQDRPPVRVTKTIEKLIDKTPPKMGHIVGLVHEKMVAAAGTTPTTTPTTSAPVGGAPTTPPPSGTTPTMPTTAVAAGPAIKHAIVVWKNHPELTALATGEDGKFATQTLPDGPYSFSITAEGYKPSTCETTLPKGGTDVKLDCAMEALPRVGSVVGVVRDATSGAPVGSVQITLTDAAKSTHQATADSAGNYKFDTLPGGTTQVEVQADGYLTLVMPMDVKVRTENHADLMLQPKPKNASVEVGKDQITIKQQIQFGLNSAVILPESFGLMTELADTLIRTPRIKRVEVQGHTDNQGPDDYNKMLSQQRADAVRQWLVQHGVTGDRLVAVGYGASQPLVPNVTEALRAKNRRVQFLIKDQDPTTP